MKTTLTNAEITIALYQCSVFTTQEICQLLNINTTSLRNINRSLYSKLNISNRIQLIREMVAHHAIEVESMPIRHILTKGGK